MSSTGQRVKEAREKKNLTASELARRMKVTPSAVLNWEKNGVIPRAVMIRRLADVLNVSQGFLLCEDALEDDPIEQSTDEASFRDLIEEIKSLVAERVGQRPVSLSLAF